LKLILKWFYLIRIIIFIFICQFLFNIILVIIIFIPCSKTEWFLLFHFLLIKIWLLINLKWRTKRSSFFFSWAFKLIIVYNILLDQILLLTNLTLCILILRFIFFIIKFNLNKHWIFIINALSIYWLSIWLKVLEILIVSLNSFLNWAIQLLI
jgi:hypothetical protein